MALKKKLVYGVGINDADYITQIFEDCKFGRYACGRYKRIMVWACPYYLRWRHMLTRCYSKKYHAKDNYKVCYVCEEWLTFSNFKAWMETQEWEGLQMDKDILFLGNKVYSPETCVFISGMTNSFVLESDKARGEWPLGVSFKKASGRFQSSCNNPFTGKMEYLGVFATPEEAHKAWLRRKLELAYQLAKTQTNPLVAEALINRYLNYNTDVESDLDLDFDI